MADQATTEHSGLPRRCSECHCNLARDNRDTMCWPCRRRQAISAQEASAVDLRRQEAFEQGRVPALAHELDSDNAEAIRYAVEEGILPRRWRSHLEDLIRLAEMPGASHVDAAEAIGVSRWTIANWRRQMGLEPGRGETRPRRDGASRGADAPPA
ncbi:MAG: hypothetical protein ACRD1G_03150 [Acidimicrobiales bacterium]